MTPRPVTQTQKHAQLMVKLCEYIRKNAAKSLSMKQLGDQVHMSPDHLRQIFSAVIGVTPKEYLDACRLRELRTSLRRGEKVTKALSQAGYSAPSRVYEKIKDRFGMTPRQYKKQGADLEISYLISKTTLGLMLIGATDRGICCIQFGETREKLQQMLTEEFPKAKITETASSTGKQLKAWSIIIDRYMRGLSRSISTLPIDISGTAFQFKVWKYLQSIPYGSVRSYSEVAKGIGHPKAVRAAASACGANNVAVLIPCHRVIRGSGGLGGYRWGLDRKKKLLEKEAIQAAKS